jgi:hypothetical protein
VLLLLLLPLLHFNAPLKEAVLALVSLGMRLIRALDAQQRLLLLVLAFRPIRRPLSCWCCCGYRI